jgi:hypothetical protein
MMHTPLPKKKTPWRKYCASMYLPRSLRTVVYKDRGIAGDDWRYFVKKYTIKEMNHRMAVQLHGKVHPAHLQSLIVKYYQVETINLSLVHKKYTSIRIESLTI